MDVRQVSDCQACRDSGDDRVVGGWGPARHDSATRWQGQASTPGSAGW